MEDVAVIFMVLFFLAIAGFMIASMWKIYLKADKPGWAAIVPVYNRVVLLELVGLPVWLVALYFIPYVNIIASLVLWILISIRLAKTFGQTSGFGVGIIFLPFIFLPMLAFGAEYEYLGVEAAEGGTPHTASRPQGGQQGGEDFFDEQQF